ncbi:MAG: peptidylprolyl isomerase [Gammaproteobacteria bacterium]
MKKLIIPMLVAGTVVLAGCQQQTQGTQSDTSAAPSTPLIKKEDAIAEVNGRYISKAALADLEKEVSQRSHGMTFPKEKLVEELIQREILMQDALQKQLDKTPEYAEQLENAKKSILTQLELKQFLSENPVTEADIKAEYDKQIAAETGTEYKARHILVKTEDEAKKLIAELDKGGDFAALANKHSLDAKESQNGGDLGWFVSSQMVAPFSDAVMKLENGKYTKEPVQTQFGWHVILRENSRAQVPPPLESVKDQLMPFLQRQKVQNMIENLRKQAKVEVLIPLADEKPKAQAPAPAEESKTAAPAEGEQAEKADKSAAESKSETARPAAETANPAETVTEESAQEAKGEKAVEPKSEAVKK